MTNGTSLSRVDETEGKINGDQWVVGVPDKTEPGKSEELMSFLEQNEVTHQQWQNQSYLLSGARGDDQSSEKEKGEWRLQRDSCEEDERGNEILGQVREDKTGGGDGLHCHETVGGTRCRKGIGGEHQKERHLSHRMD